MFAAPIPAQQDGHQPALHLLSAIAAPPEVAFHELAALAARICGTPIALVALSEENRLGLKANHGLAAGAAPRALSFCAHALNQSAELLIIPDALRDPRFAGSPFVCGDPGARFYAGVPLRTPDGHAVGTLCVIDLLPRSLTSDQTEALRVLGHQIMTQLELRRCLSEVHLNNSRLEKSQRLGGLGEWDYDFVTQHMFWSDEVYRILGLSRSDCPPCCEAFERRVHPDDLALFLRARKAVQNGKPRVNFEHRIVRPDGEVRHVHHAAETIFDDQGRSVVETGTIRDVTDRQLADTALRESEERFKFVARAVSDVVWDWNLATNTLWWNDGFLTTFGFVAHEIAPSIESWTGRIHPDERRKVVAGIHRAINGGAETWSADYRFQRKDGSYASVHDRGYILRDAAGRGVRMVGGMRDLTAEKKNEAEHLRAQRMESIGTLAGGIAHDLNNVLAPIMMSIELLKLGSGGDPQRLKILDAIHASCRRGAGLVQQVLSFARGLEGQRISIPLRHLLDELEGIITETFPRSIRVVTEVSPALWSVTGDPTQLHQLLLNLAVNARDAMPHGGTLTLSAANLTLDAHSAGLSPDAKAGPYVRLQLTDTGAGMPSEVRERIFEPFFTTKAPGKGTGLGLAIVHTVVKAHGGFLSVDSEAGCGTTFTIYLPADPALQTAGSMHPLPTDLPCGRGELVLVVDDEAAIRDITRRTLEIFGYRVLTASDGAEAVALYAQHGREIAVVLTDMTMPVMDGAATIAALLRTNPAARIIAASGLSSGATIAKETRDSVQDFLPKPYTAETLLTRIREVLARPALVASETTGSLR